MHAPTRSLPSLSDSLRFVGQLLIVALTTPMSSAQLARRILEDSKLVPLCWFQGLSEPVVAPVPAPRELGAVSFLSMSMFPSRPVAGLESS